MPDMVKQAIEALPPLRDVIRGAGLNARRGLGQNFLLDLNLTGRIVKESRPLSDTVIEIGPGPGGLTRALLLNGASHVIAIEKDPRASAALAPLVEAADGRLEVINGDALKIDIADIAAKMENNKCQIVANLPYNIATPLLLGWLDRLEHIRSMTLMFQKEVGGRITANSGNAAYGRLSVICQWLCETAALFDIPPQAFVPPPKVISSVVRLTPRPTPLARADKPMLEEITRVVFGQRRKMIRASLKQLGGDNALLNMTGLGGDLRPEQLTIEEFCALAEALKTLRANDPHAGF